MATTALDALIQMFASYGLEDLAREVGALAADPDLTDAERFVAVYELDAYKKRFPAMETLRKRGEAIDEATYINQERAYRDVLTNAGLPKGFYDDRQDFAGWMLGAVSPDELAKRVGAAKRIVDSSDPGLRQAAREFYGVDGDALLAYAIDPVRAQPIIDRQMRAIETGAAANRYRFELDRAAAEALATDPMTEGLGAEQLRDGFRTARTLADQDLRLSSIEGTGYSEDEAIDSVLRGDLDSQMRSQRRAERESARFSGRSGLSSGSLRTR